LRAPTLASTVKLMARARRPNEPSSYEGAPQIPTEMKQRFDLVKAVLGDRTTISEAAEQLQIARVNMQTLVHRAEAAILGALQPRPTGPTPKSPEQKQLEHRLAQLEKENAKLKTQLQAADDMMGAAGEIIRHLRGLPPRTSKTSSSRSKRSPPKPPSSDDDSEPERATRQHTLRRALMALTMRDVKTHAARLLKLAAPTLQRWIERLATERPLWSPRGGVRQPGPPSSEERVRELVTSLHGLVGASSLAHSVVGVSRRRAAEIKQDVLTTVERARKDSCTRVEVLEPGVVRGFDAMHVRNSYALIAADAAVPYRTSVANVDHYDAESVAAVLERDFEMHGAPWVLRYDRARCHTAPAVLSVVERYRVLVMQGPAYHACFYGQLERQNREHRHWLACSEPTSDDMQSALDRMKSAFNDDWRRPTLGWRTPSECWNQRRTRDDERDSFLDDVNERAARLRDHDVEVSLAMRLAIEQALTQKGILRITPGRQVLCELTL
jgi:transposase-like protein